MTTHTDQLGNEHIDIIRRLLDKTWQTFYRVTTNTNQLGNKLLCQSHRIIGNFGTYLSYLPLIPPYDTNAFTLITIIRGLFDKTRQTFYRVTTHTNQLGNKLLCQSHRIIVNFGTYLTYLLIILPYDTNAFTLITIIQGPLYKTRLIFYRVTTHTKQIENELLCQSHRIIVNFGTYLTYLTYLLIILPYDNNAFTLITIIQGPLDKTWLTTHTNQLDNELLCQSHRIIGNFRTYLTYLLVITMYDMYDTSIVIIPELLKNSTDILQGDWTHHLTREWTCVPTSWNLW